MNSDFEPPCDDYVDAYYEALTDCDPSYDFDDGDAITYVDPNDFED